MAKVLLIGDNHNGANGNNQRMLRQNVELYNNFLKPLIKFHHIDFCIDLGDFFDDREKIDVRVLKTVRQEMLNDLEVPWYFIVGNHNLYYKNENRVNNLQETIGDLPNVHIVDTFKQVGNIDLIPWISDKNKDFISECVKASNNRFCCGHFEFSGFQFDKSRVADVKEKLTAGTFAKYEKVFSGHYHIASEKGNIIYVGTPIQLTWIDVDVEKQVIILDTDTGEITPCINPNNLYAQFKLPDDGDLTGFNEEDIKDKRVKVIYNINIDKDILNKVQAILKSYLPEQLTFVPTGTKKKEDEKIVNITNGLDSAFKEYIALLPIESDKVKEVIEKLVLSYYNKTQQ